MSFGISRPPGAGDRVAILSIARTYAAVEEEAFAPLLAHMRVVDLRSGEIWLRAGDAPPLECFVLNGLLRTWVDDARGRSATLDFHEGPCALVPSIARTANGRSRVHCEALRDTRIAVFGAEKLNQYMPLVAGLQCWGDAVLRAELLRRADREWSLATLTARERLLAWRQAHPGMESRVPHHHLASYLGITPVSLSRLRAQLKTSDSTVVSAPD